ncbi:MBOAT, membrane-bound O-acyltransferase family-domain-containing protein [Syncephalis fuscata]|nr:MBOAT, membrane-bound O-acyltransferase family-domain-containing protein [Syncephalis fuscata]
MTSSLPVSATPTANVTPTKSATTANTEKAGQSSHSNGNRPGQTRPHLADELASGRMTPPPPFRYRPQSSRLDREHLRDTREQFRGFVNLFWTAMAAYVVLTAMRNFREQGIIFSGRLFDLFSTDALILIVSDATMVALTGFFAVPWSWLASRGWIPRQTAFITMAVVWAHWRSWPWIQTTFFVLHSIVMLMKTHSYLARNHEMVDMRHRVIVLKQWLNREKKSQLATTMEVADTTASEEEEELNSSTSTPTKEQKMALLSAVTEIVEDAQSNAATLSALDSDIGSDTGFTGTSTALANHKGDGSPSGRVLRERRGKQAPTRHMLKSQASEPILHTLSTTATHSNKLRDTVSEPVSGTHSQLSTPSAESINAKTVTSSGKRSKEQRPMPSALLMDLMRAEKRHASTPHIASDTLLSGHSDAHINRADARRELEELEADLCPGTCAYPNNITFRNYLDYLIIPTLVYEIYYPRTARIRPAYVFEKLAAILGTFTLLYMTVEHYVLPALYQTSHLPIWYALPQMLFPVLVVFLLSFFIIFEFICNAFAELACFADRSFYDDWWNSTTFEEFARNWNKPVHHFLLRHVYVPLYRDCNLTRYNASMATFLISSIFHEFAIAIVCGNLRMYLFSFQMLQLPLIWLGKQVGPQGREIAGNWFFWFSMTVGPPLLLCLYCREIIQPNGSFFTMILGGEPMA